MSLLAQLYLAGLATITLPLLFHFLRRSPRGVLPFSSLMFLTPSPPRLTRRSRIDHWLLLLLRAAALALLALAFARPFIRTESRLAWEQERGRRIAVLVDTSASMRRAGLWQAAELAFDQTLEEMKPRDQVALFAFDRDLQVAVDFADDAQQPELQLQALKNGFGSLQPSWSQTLLGAALSGLADRLESYEDREGEERPLQIILISDLAAGADLAALQAVSWSERVSVDLKAVQAEEPNAAVQLLQKGNDSKDPLAARLRVVNDGDAIAQLSVGWREDATEEAELIGEESVEAPSAGSRVVLLRREEEQAAADQIVLRGDAHEFDNVCYIAPPGKREVRVMFWGDEAKEDAEGLRFYFENASATAPHRELQVDTFAAGDEPPQLLMTEANLVVVTATLSEQQAKHARDAVQAGARLLVVLRAADGAAMLNELLPAGCECEAVEAGGEYSLLTNIDFNHPVFAPLASARYNDFTQVHFWKHRRLRFDGEAEPPDAIRTLAKFDDGDLAIAQWTLADGAEGSTEPPSGRGGAVVLLTSGWQPSDSRLALSTKFVPLASSLLDPEVAEQASMQFQVDDVVPRDRLPESLRDSALTVTTPSGDEAAWPPEQPFAAASEPGVYRVAGPPSAANGTEAWQFAVNLAPAESQTRPMDESVLAANGVRMGQSLALGLEQRQRQRKNTELENRQKLWQWLVAGCLVVLILESLLAAWYGKRAEGRHAEGGASVG